MFLLAEENHCLGPALPVARSENGAFHCSTQFLVTKPRSVVPVKLSNLTVKTAISMPFRQWINLVWIGLSCLHAGCSKIEFLPNRLAAAATLQSTDEMQVDKVAGEAYAIATTLFGTPDEPSWPTELPNVVDMAEVSRSAGPVGRAYDKIERGLYRKHCVQCHGITGDGAGAAASLLAPYPRDFRRGTFKFKSTSIGTKPNKADLVRILERGIPGSSMPSFAPLRNRVEFENDIEALVEYVVYLSIRGEVERRLIQALVENENLEQSEVLSIARRVAESWQGTGDPLSIPIVPNLEGEALAQSVERGKQLFKSEKTACNKCHGEDARGDGVSQDYDEWTKDWTIRAGIDPANRSEWKAMKPFGALKPVVNRSRNLHLGALRGGASVEDITKRIALGIDGAPMPAAALGDGSSHSLHSEELFDLVRYVASITRVARPHDTSDSEAQHGTR